MRINPNLQRQSEFNRNNIVNYNSSVNIDFLNDNTIKIKKKEEAALGVIFVNLSNWIEQKTKITFTGELELISGPSVMLVFGGFDTGSLNITRKGKNFIEATGSKNPYGNQVQVRVSHNEEVIFKFVKIKLEEGDKATPYIPRKDTIERAKRQYFIGGGDFKEVYPIS